MQSSSPTFFRQAPPCVARWLAAPLLAVPMLLGGCDDRPLPVAPSDDPAAAAAAAPSTIRTPKGDLVTGEPAVFAQALEEIGLDGKVLVWIKETGTPRPSAEFLLNLPGSAAETIALPAESPGARRRNALGPASVRGASVDAVVRALGQTGAVSLRRMEVLPVLSARLPATTRVAALRVLLQHPNVDYVSAVRARPGEPQAAPLGQNLADSKHTVHDVLRAWDRTRGLGMKIGILDSGLARISSTGGFHQDALFTSTPEGGHGVIALGFVDDGCGSTTANTGACITYDDHGHGSAMVGLAGGNDNNIGIVGMAPLATTYSMKIAWNTHVHGHCGDNPFNDSRYCIEDDDYLRSIDYAASRRMHVLSMSFSEGGNSDIYRAFSTAYHTYGVFLVAATGNTVGASAIEPASYDVVMGVGGVDGLGNNLYSTAARDVSGFAAGRTLGATCYKTTYCDAGLPSLYTDGGGTSAATANVAGIVALVRAAHPTESVSQIWNRLVASATGANRVVNAWGAITYGSTLPLSVSISGPEFPPANTNQTWTATAANGTGPYTYTWFRDGVAVGTGATYTGYVDGDFHLQVNAADAAGGSASAELWVTAAF